MSSSQPCPIHLWNICRLDPRQISTQITGIQIIVVKGDIANDLHMCQASKLDPLVFPIN